MSLLIKKTNIPWKPLKSLGLWAWAAHSPCLVPAVKAVLSFTTAQYLFAMAGKQTKVSSVTSALPEHIEVGGNQIRLLLIPWSHVQKYLPCTEMACLRASVHFVKKKHAACHSSATRLKPVPTAVTLWQCTEGDSEWRPAESMCFGYWPLDS